MMGGAAKTDYVKLEPRNWADFDDAERRKWCDWIVTTCLMHGSTRKTAYTVAGLFADGLDFSAGVQ